MVLSAVNLLVQKPKQNPINFVDKMWHNLCKSRRWGGTGHGERRQGYVK